MKKALFIVLMFLLPSLSLAAGTWETQGNLYFLSKNTREYFSAPGAGANDFANKYQNFDGIDFLVKGPKEWTDYGRLNLEGNNSFALPIASGTKLEELHFLAGGNYGNAYKNDSLLSLYGANYYYGTITVFFTYQDDSHKVLSVPIFWDWFHLPSQGWSKDGAKIKSIGNNPVRNNCAMYHITFINPKPSEPLKNVLISDSWVGDFPFSDIFAVTVKSNDVLE